MNLKFRTKRECRLVFLLILICLIIFFLFWGVKKNPWTTYDFMALDYFYRYAVKKGYGPETSFMPQITYLTITDETYQYFEKNVLDRRELARINSALSRLNPEAVVYDMIFARPGPGDSDEIFAHSFSEIDSVYLPVGCALSETSDSVKWNKNSDTRPPFQVADLIRPAKETGTGTPFHAARVLLQNKKLRKCVKGTGDISIRADPDGIYRHIPLVIRVGEAYLPTLSLAMFLNRARISSEDIIINWGRHMTLKMPARNQQGDDIKIPIDHRGCAFVPLVDFMGKDFPVIAVHTFLQAFDDEKLRGNLLELFEGSYVFVADVATGAADLGATPLEKATPLVTMHTSFLNALETKTFYSRWHLAEVMFLLVLVIFCLCGSALFRHSKVIYGLGFFVMIGLPLLTWTELLHFRLLPIVTITLISLVFFITLIIFLQYTAAKEKKLVKNVFARYVPSAVVNQLMVNPDNLKLGGEERTATVLFSDIADFTAISERLDPEDLVSLLNSYLTEMTTVIMDHGGIIDKFQGDAIMAEFGVPLFCSDHADRAVAAGLDMQRRLSELRREWQQTGIEALYCRIGINTGRMIAGNMGSNRVLDYTVIGDAVNLASRLEGANKRYGTSLMISEFTLRSLSSDLYRIRVLDIIQVKGKSEAVKVYEVYGYQKESISYRQKEYCLLYEKAFAAYLEKNFSLAFEYFTRALEFIPDDRATKQMLSRIKELCFEDLPRDWGGSVQLTDK